MLSQKKREKYKLQKKANIEFFSQLLDVKQKKNMYTQKELPDVCQCLINVCYSKKIKE